jgi:hypothetical protein
MGTKRRRFTQDSKTRAALPASRNDQGVSADSQGSGLVTLGSGAPSSPGRKHFFPRSPPRRPLRTSRSISSFVEILSLKHARNCAQ